MTRHFGPLILIPLVFLSLFAATTNAPAQTPTPKADIIFIHANIYTGVANNSSQETSKRPSALAIRGDRILAVGTREEVEKFKGPKTKVVNLDGHFVMPGFNDAHMHMASAGLEKLNVNLVGTKTLEELRARLRAKCEAASPGEWVVGEGWDHTLWPVKVTPTRLDIDDVSGSHPVFLIRVDGHIGVANTRALQLAQITAATHDPDGGKIDRDESGAPTGILREKAKQLILSAIPPPTHEKRRRAIELALADLASHGITSAQDFSQWEDFKVYEELEAEGKLTARISEWLPFDLSLEQLNRMRTSHPASDNMLHTGMLKGFMDGSLGSRTAALFAPYSDDPGNTGIPQYDQAKLNAMTKERLLAGYQIGFHAIGDKAVQMALDAFAEAEKAAGQASTKESNQAGVKSPLPNSLFTRPDGKASLEFPLRSVRVTTYLREIRWSCNQQPSPAGASYPQQSSPAGASYPQQPSPGGASYRSPALQRGVSGKSNQSPGGTTQLNDGPAQATGEINGAPTAHPDYRLRIEHAQVTTPEQIERFKDLGVIASMQPSHLLTDMNWVESRLGPERAKTAYAWAEFLRNGVVLAFGTDYPVEPVTPFRGIYSAVTRMNEDGKKTYPGQKLTIEQAIAAYTTSAAYAEFAEKQKGTLAPGMLADFVVLDRDITTVPPQEILATRVLRTVVGGKTVYEAK
ncbi:MAG: amidohydrolase [Terriglobales bacterium]